MSYPPLLAECRSERSVCAVLLYAEWQQLIDKSRAEEKSIKIVNAYKKKPRGILTSPLIHISGIFTIDRNKSISLSLPFSGNSLE